MIVRDGVVCRKTGKSLKNTAKGQIYYDWHFIKAQGSGVSGRMEIKNICFPDEYVGKKIRLKVEVIEE